MDTLEQLEATLRADPDDREAALVYADALQEAGDPLGEQIQLSEAIVRARGAQRRCLFELEAAHRCRHAEALLGSLATRPPGARVGVRWRNGFVDHLRLVEPDVGAAAPMDRPPQGDIGDLVVEAFGLRACIGMRTLSLFVRSNQRAVNCARKIVNAPIVPRLWKLDLRTPGSFRRPTAERLKSQLRTRFPDLA